MPAPIGGTLSVGGAPARLDMTSDANFYDLNTLFGTPRAGAVHHPNCPSSWRAEQGALAGPMGEVIY